MRLARNLGRVLFLGGLASIGACMPLISHSPKVDRGFQLTGTYSMALASMRDLADSTQKMVTSGAFSIGTSLGYRDALAADGFAGQVGLEASFLNGAIIDAYVQAPTRWTGSTDAGIGIARTVGAYTGEIGYVQLGRRFGRSYIFSTQAIALLANQFDQGRPLRWQPMLAIQPFESQRRSMFFFVAGAIGPSHDRCGQFPCADYTTFRPPPARLMFGMSASRLLF